jgi:NitT/TauT family transport system substrate-binding protein
LFLLWFGLGIWSKVALAVTLVFFIMFFNAYQGVRQADPVIIENVRMLGASERQLVRHVLVPSALTWIFSSLQASLGFAMIGAVVGEYLGATRGLGYVISQAEGTFDTTGVFSGMAILSLVVLVMSTAVARAERWLLRWKVAILVAAVAGISSTACGTANDEPGTHVRVAIGGQTQMVYLPTTLAQELGFYKAEGLDVELQDFEGGAKALQALIGGSADVVSGFYDHTIQMAAEGRALTAFVVMLRYPGLVLVTSPQAAGRVTNVSALQGGIAGVTTPGSSSQLFLNVLLAKHGVPIQSVSAVAIGSGATAVAALERGRVDAGWIGDPGLTILRRRNPGVRTLADLRDERGTHEAFGTGSYPSSVLYTHTPWLEKNRATASRLARAIVRTLRWMQQHSNEEIAEKTPPALRGDDLALYAESLKNSRGMFSTDGLMAADGAAAVRDVLAESNPKVKSAAINLSDTYTNDLVAAR